MVGSFNTIDYRLRPAKHAERAMLVDLFKRLRFGPIEEYQYVGFGSVAFVDFRMVHRALGITDLVSIEDTSDPAEQIRFDKNRPYSKIQLLFGNSKTILPRLDFSRRSLVWLDYDQAARRSMLNDLITVARDAPSGTFLAMTFTNAFPTDKAGAEKQVAHLRDGFPEFVDSSAKPQDFAGNKYAEFVRTTFGAELQTAVSDADAGKSSPIDKRRVVQVCFIKYKDGVKMATIAWIIVAERDAPTLEDCGFDALPFYSPTDKAFTIEMPKVTPMEIREMELMLPSPHVAASLAWLPEAERESFAKNYRYLPNFAPVEAV